MEVDPDLWEKVIDLGLHHITVNAIAPDGIATPGSPTGLPREQMEVLTKGFLASPAADCITGETLVVDGGYWLL